MPEKDLQNNPDKKDAQIKTGVGAVGAGNTPKQTRTEDQLNLDNLLTEKQPTEPESNLAESASGAIVDRALTPPERFQVDGDNTPIAPMPRNQIDKDPAEDPMRRPPGEIPYQRNAQNAAMEEEGVQPYVMVMPYWDGVAIHPKGSVLHFRPADAPYGAKLVVKDK